jgi:hypothetical protein
MALLPFNQKIVGVDLGIAETTSLFDPIKLD